MVISETVNVLTDEEAVKVFLLADEEDVLRVS